MSTAKRHHYLPQFFLRGFCQGSRFYVFDQQRNEGRLATPLNTAVIGYYYSYVDEEGARVEEVESDLARLESRARPVFDAFSDRDAISPEQRCYMAVFLGFLACRTPAFERTLDETLTGLAEVMLRKNLLQPNADDLFESSAAEIADYLDSGRFGLRAHSNERISQMIEQAPKLGRSFVTSDWTVLLTSESNAFVTSDNPFVCAQASRSEDGGFQEFGMASPEVPTYFPLSSRQCLVMSGSGGTLSYGGATKGQVRSINLATVAESERLVVGRDEAQVRSLVRRARGIGS